MRTIRAVLKSRKKTQAEFAKSFGVSIATAKRWLSGAGVSLEIFCEILEYLDLNFEDFGKLISNSQKKNFQYTLDQENFLSENPEFLSYFDQLLNGSSSEKIASKWKLSTLSTRRYLSGLERIGLVEVHAHNRVRITKSGEQILCRRKDWQTASKVRHLRV